MLPPIPSLVVLFSLSTALAHSHVAYVLINGLHYPGHDPTGRTANPPSAVGWSTTAADDGFVAPSGYTGRDIICHRDGAAPRAHAPVRAGDAVHVQWNGWPLSHRGPVLSYLAPCDTPTGCAGVRDPATLRFTKIDESFPALLEATGAGAGESPPPVGRWATEVLIGANNSWQVGIPRGIKGGAYVLRHEIVALHYAGREDGAQNYPQCVNLWVEGDDGGGGAGEGVDLRGGLPATELYGAEDPGVAVDIYGGGVRTYVIPGPTVVAGAEPVGMDGQSMSVLRGAGTPVVVVGGTRTVPFGGAEETGR